MTVSKEKALALIREKIREFESVLEHATYENRNDERYNRAYYGTKSLIQELFSEKEVQQFSNAVNIGFFLGGGSIDRQERLNDYRIKSRR